MANRGFICSQSGVYPGPNPDDIVEVDIEGTLVKFALDSDADVRNIGLSTIVECKKAHLPWVLFSAPVSKRTYAEPLKRHSEGLGDYIYAQLGIDHFRTPHRLLQPPPMLGFSLRTGLIQTQEESSQKKDGFPREAKQSAEAAVSQLRHETLAWTRAHALAEDDNPVYSGWILFPVIVLEGKLFQCHLFEENRPVVQAIDHGLLSLPAPKTDVAGLPIDIVTEEAFPRLLDDLLELSTLAEKALKVFVKRENKRIAAEWDAAKNQNEVDPS